jgi:Ca-activated chloride channel family protein
MKFNNLYWFLLLLLILPLLRVGVLVGKKQYAKRLRLLIAPHLHGLLLKDTGGKKRRRQLILFGIALVCLTASLARPLLKEKESLVEREGVDFLIAVDTSRSMLVQDSAPFDHRMDAAKSAIRELISTQLSSARIGLLAFAGKARMLTPLTLNYDTFNLVLDGLSTESIWQPGSDLSQVIEMAAEKLGRNNLEAPVLVIISDGEALEGDAVMAARQAKMNHRLTLFTVGVGRPEGGPIPMEKRDAGGYVIQTENLLDEMGEDVVSGLNETMLRTLAQVTGGAYVRVNPEDVSADLIEMYQEKIQPMAKSMRVAKVVSHEEAFQIPLAIALVLLLLEMVIMDRRKRVKK